MLGVQNTQGSDHLAVQNTSRSAFFKTNQATGDCIDKAPDPNTNNDPIPNPEHGSV